MITNSVICCETREEARKIALRNGRGYLVTMVNMYHDSMPKSQDAITWPSAPLSLKDLSGGDDDALLDAIIDGGNMLCGTPDEVAEQIARWGEVGMDQLVFGMPVEGMHREEVLQCLELFGDKVIPRVRPRPHPLHRPLPRDRAAEVPDVQPPAARRGRVADGHPGERARPALGWTPLPRRAARLHRHQGTAAPRSGAAVRAGAASTR